MEHQNDLGLMKLILYSVKQEYEMYGLGISKENLIEIGKLNGFQEKCILEMIDSPFVYIFMSISEFPSGRKVYKWSDRRCQNTKIKHTQSVISFPIKEYLLPMIEQRKNILFSNAILGAEREELEAEIDLLESIHAEN